MQRAVTRPAAGCEERRASRARGHQRQRQLELASFGHRGGPRRWTHKRAPCTCRGWLTAKKERKFSIRDTGLCYRVTDPLRTYSLLLERVCTQATEPAHRAKSKSERKAVVKRSEVIIGEVVTKYRRNGTTGVSTTSSGKYDARTHTRERRKINMNTDIAGPGDSGNQVSYAYAVG